MKLLILTRYDRLGASSRLRSFQYAEEFRQANFEASFSPFFGRPYLERLYSGQWTLGAAFGAYARRVGQLKNARQTDLIWIEKEALPWLPWSIERALLSRSVPYVVDYDDAVFHRYDLHHSAIVRRLLGRKLDKLMAAASLVTAGNQYLADRASAAGATRIEIVPTVVDLSAYTYRPAAASSKAPSIGWIGTPSTWNEYVAPMMPMLLREAEAEGARIIAVGAGSGAVANHLFDSVPWTEESEVERIHEMDIGIMPLDDSPWARGKCGYKLIQYMACGLPVIASPVGVNAEIVEHGVNGFLATTKGEWEEALRTLLRAPALRLQMGQEGRRKVEQLYSLQLWGPRVAHMLRDTVNEGKRV